VDALVVDGRSEAMMVNWLYMMLDRKSNEHTEERDCLWRKAKHTIFGSVAANIDYSLVSELSYFFLQLRIGPTDLFMVVPRNDAIFPKLQHTNRY
jgi:hypothetical protein